MDMKSKLFLLSFLFAASTSAFANENTRKVIYVNSDVTTHIVMPENLKLVDISTNDLVGNQCADNMIRIKPVELDTVGNPNFYQKNQFLGTVTMIGERHMAQFDLRYEPLPSKANAIYEVTYEDTYNYSNPEVKMPESEMVRLAWTAHDSKRKFNNIREQQYGIKGEVYNIYTIGDYFFIDFKLTNLTNIPYDIAELRVNLSDKKQTKSTNYQTLELTPLFVLNNADSFKKDYRQVIVLEKLTFPDEKVLNIEVSEDQISGRVITIPILYDDILHADALNIDKISKELEAVKNSRALEKYYQERETAWQKKNEKLAVTNKKLVNEIKESNQAISDLKRQIKEERKNEKNSVEAEKIVKETKYIYTKPAPSITVDGANK